MNSRRLTALLLAAGLLGTLAVGSAASAEPNELAPKHMLKPVGGGIADGSLPDNSNGNGNPGGDAKPSRPGGSSNGISYHGGPVVLGTTNAYVIWYGNWSGNTAQNTLTNLLEHVGGSSYFNINTTYSNGSNAHISNSVHYAGSTTDNAHGTSLSDSTINTIVSDAVSSGRLPKDPNAVYFVLTAAGVAETSGFLSQYCGWHTHATISGSDLKYAFIGDPTGPNVGACAQQTSGSPNDNVGADAMASVISHELEEAVTDPDLNAWYDTRGYENADKCAWTFGTTRTATNGSLYNMTLGGLNYLIQRNWVNASGGYCALSY